MRTFQNTNRRKAPTLDPKRLLKHSQVVRQAAQSVFVSGNRESTPTGFVVKGFSNGKFETFFETLMAGAATATFRHAKKDRSVRIVGGMGFVVIGDSDGTPAVERRLHPGDEVVLAAGTTYSFTTSSGTQLEMFVVQDANYAARLEEVAPPGSAVAASDDVLALNHRPMPEVVIERRRSSKAAQQQAALRPDAVTPDAQAPVAEEGLNVRPSMGLFDADGAG